MIKKKHNPNNNNSGTFRIVQIMSSSIIYCDVLCMSYCHIACHVHGAGTHLAPHVVAAEPQGLQLRVERRDAALQVLQLIVHMKPRRAE